MPPADRLRSCPPFTRTADTCAIDQHARNAMNGLRLRERSSNQSFVSHITIDGNTVDLRSDFLCVTLVHVEYSNLRAPGSHRARGCCAETGATTGDEYRDVLYLH